MVRKKKEKALNYLLPGISIFFLGIGSLFSVDLAGYNLWIFLVGVLVLIFYVNESLIANFRKERLSKIKIASGFIGLMLLTLLFGIQATPLPFKEYIVGIGIILVLIGIWKLKL